MLGVNTLAGVRTSDGSADFCGGGLPHLQRCLLAVPGCVWRADQVGGIFERTLGKTRGKYCDSLLFFFLKVLLGNKRIKHTTSENRPEWLRLMNIQGCSSYSAFLQGLSQSLLIHQTATGRVDQERTLTHLNAHRKKRKNTKKRCI